MQSNSIKTIFVCEFITGGGFHHSDLPMELATQGALMHNALLRDLSSLAYTVNTTVDERVMNPANCNDCRKVAAQDDVWQIWEEAIQQSDVVWIIAPETDGHLERLTAIAAKHDKGIIGCCLTSIKVFSNKLKTYQLLKQSSIETLPTYLFSDWAKEGSAKWLAKPVDGAGCEDTIYFPNAEELACWIVLNNKQETHIIQPFQIGDAASISCVIHQGKAEVLSCNEQLVTINDNVLSFQGCVVNGMRQHWKVFSEVANEIAQLLPDISGYVGIDVVVSDEAVIVIEVNPRLTTSYIVLDEATGKNPAELIMKRCSQKNYVFPDIERNVVKLEMSQQYA